jgi:phosphoglycerate dehydrogenase-like enzyme
LVDKDNRDPGSVWMADRNPPTVVVLQADTDPPRMEPVYRLADVRHTTADRLPEALPGADALFVWDFRTTAVAGAWRYADRLRWVHIASAGVDRLMFDELADSDVTVTNSRGVFDDAIADHVLMMVLCFAKDLHTTIRLQADRVWRHRETERIAGTTALVVGTGPIGRAIGRRLTSMGMTVLGVGRTGRPSDPDLGTVLPMDQLAEALALADYVVLAAPLTPGTRNMIDAAALAAMRPTARLINIGRGELVVEDDLVEALRHNRISGAALDVFVEEPLADSSPLWAMPNVVVSPHMSGDVVGWRDELVALFLDNLGRFRDGGPLLNVVDKQLGYVPTGSRQPT